MAPVFCIWPAARLTRASPFSNILARYSLGHGRCLLPRSCVIGSPTGEALLQMLRGNRNRPIWADQIRCSRQHVLQFFCLNAMPVARQLACQAERCPSSVLKACLHSDSEREDRMGVCELAASALSHPACFALVSIFRVVHFGAPPLVLRFRTRFEFPIFETPRTLAMENSRIFPAAVCPWPYLLALSAFGRIY